MSKAIKVKSKTVRTRNALKATKIGLYGAKFLMPAVPSTVMTIINWDDWFKQTEGYLPAGFVALLIGAIISVIGIAKRDELVKKHISPLFIFSLALFVVAGAFLWLAAVMKEAGVMFLWTACAVAASAVDDQVDKSVLSPMIQELDEDIKEGGLSKKDNKRAARKQKRLAEMAEARRRAVE